MNECPVFVLIRQFHSDLCFSDISATIFWHFDNRQTLFTN